MGSLSGSRPTGARTVLSGEDLRRSYCEATSGGVWVARSIKLLRELTDPYVRPLPNQRLLFVGKLPAISRHLLDTWFRQIVVAGDGISLLKSSELFEALAVENRADLLVGCAYDRNSDAVVLYRGSLETVVVPASWFHEGRAGARSNLAALVPVDYGNTLRIGDYEIATDALLYEFDVEYRRRARKRAVDKDDSLGGSIRRLRLQKRLTQSDFGVPMKTIARIERGEVLAPQAATLRAIAKRLGVSVEELGTY